MTRIGTDAIFRELNGTRIAVIKPSALGDVVQALPLLPVLRSRFPGARLTWVIQRELGDLVQNHPCLDDVMCLERRPSWSAALTCLAELRRQRFDIVFDLQGLLRSAVMTLATGARWRIGLETAREGAAGSVNLTVPGTGKSVPAHARYWRIAECLGCGDLTRQSWLTVSVDDLQQARNWLQPLPRPILAVQWGAKWVTKRWPLAGFADVLARAGRTWRGSVVIVGGRGEWSECEWLASQLKAAFGGPAVLNLAGRTSIKQLGAVLSAVDAVVSNDSGPLHLAAELGTPTLGIFTCTSAARSGPPGPSHEFVSTEVPCAASYRKTCPHRGSGHMACHGELTSERVWQGLCRLVDKHSLTPRRWRRAA